LFSAAGVVNGAAAKATSTYVQDPEEMISFRIEGGNEIRRSSIPDLQVDLDNGRFVGMTVRADVNTIVLPPAAMLYVEPDAPFWIMTPLKGGVCDTRPLWVLSITETHASYLSCFSCLTQ